jgi:mannose-6-phosphate isomerase-like protein (cupin superfamily)
MKNHVLKPPENYSFEKVGIKGKKFSVTDITPKTGVCLIETEGGHETTIIEHECDFIYYILDGAGRFIIDGQNENCIKGDLVVVPAGSRFRYTGKLKMLLITTPAFYPEQEETL